MELQILDNTADRYKDLKSYQYHGSVYGTIPALRGYLNPVGKWNTQEVIADGTKIKIILNGTTILDGDIAIYVENGKTIDGKNHPGLGNKKGHIGFLGHGSQLWFKDIEIKELSDTPVAKVSGEWENLFDGKSLDNWKMFNGGKVKGWIVEDGNLVALGKGGDLGGDIITTKEYDNFVFNVDWKTGKGANSGIMYHVVENKMFGQAPYAIGPEYQIIDDKNFAAMNKGLAGYNRSMGVTENVTELQPWCQAGCDYAMHLADDSIKKLNPPGQWNNSKIVFDNGHVEHWLNGQKILEFTAWSKDWFKRRDSGKWKNKPEYGLSPIGHICLQDHGAKIWFKNIKLKQLPKKKKEPVALFNGKDLSGWKNFGEEKWYVKDGLLVCESGPNKKYGYLGTERYYKDFDLNLEFKQLSNGNSGVFIRSTVQGTIVNGWQVEVAPLNKDTGGIYESYGRGWLEQIPAEKEKNLKVGEWNKMRIKVVGNRITTWLNGVQMVDLKDDKIGAAIGRIALQIHSGGDIKIQWKNIVIQEL
ncbi:MAG: DUF1080 domain-containing protein [Lentisphaeria bacterium]|nr:DUF1080 domain-containing protein [Lentisphaeria bacterium]